MSDLTYLSDLTDKQLAARIADIRNSLSGEPAYSTVVTSAILSECIRRLRWSAEMKVNRSFKGQITAEDYVQAIKDGLTPGDRESKVWL